MNGLTISAVLSDVLETKKIELIDVYTIEIDNNTMVSKIVVLLSKIYPFTRCLQHLKRVKRDPNATKSFRLIVGPVDCLKKNQIREQLQGIDYQNLSIFRVPKNKPFNRWQFEECIKYWPTNFHENKYLTNCLTGYRFDEIEKEKIKNFMLKVISFSRANNFSTYGIIVNNQQEIIASSTDLIDHPLRHCVINLIDKVASFQGGGVWYKSQNLTQTNLKKKKMTLIFVLVTTFLSTLSRV